MTITRSQAARISQSEDADVGGQGQDVGQGQGVVRGGRGAHGGRATGGRRGGARGAAGTRNRQAETCPAQPQVSEDPANDSFFDDPGHGEKLQARSGCLGTIGNRGWEAKTNFLIDVYALIDSSSKYKLKGNRD